MTPEELDEREKEFKLHWKKLYTFRGNYLRDSVLPLIALIRKLQKPKICKWKYNGRFYETSCGYNFNAVAFVSASVKFCPNCSGGVKVVK